MVGQVISGFVCGFVLVLLFGIAIIVCAVLAGAINDDEGKK